jgi:hypothetical protein
MRQQLYTRKDDGVGDGLFDSIAWLFDVHLKEKDNKRIKSAVVYGQNEDSPERVDLFLKHSPLVTDMPIRIWIPTE